MKILGRDSWSHILYFFVTIFWFLFGIVVVLAPLLMIFDYNNDTGPGIKTEMRFNLSEPMIVPDQPFEVEVRVVAIDLIELKKYSDTPFFTFLIMLFLMLLFSFYVLTLFRRFCKSAVDEELFTVESFNRLRLLGILMMLYTPLLWLTTFIINRALASAIGDNLYKLDSGADSTYLLIGFFVVIISESFRQAYQLQEEQKLTI